MVSVQKGTSMNTVLFDLDGTLLPLDFEIFIKTYFSVLTKSFSHLGTPEKLIKAVWHGTDAMVKNDGLRINRDVFWDAFSAVIGSDMRRYEPDFDSFYANEFSAVRAVTSPSPAANECVKALKKRGYSVVLATNPIFPAVATEARISWAGLDKEDFEFISTYENSRFCKPNPEYFGEILQRIGKEPADCLMVGNDVKEDGAAVKAGIPLYLLDGCIIECDNYPAEYTRGDFDALKDFIESLPYIK